MRLIGLTGGISSGKSTISSYIKEALDIPVIDADLIARQITEKGTPTYKKIVNHFGSSILMGTGEIDRAKLGDIIFSEPSQRKVLNSITHPAIRWEMFKKILYYYVTLHRMVVLDVPLLYETRLDRFVDPVIVVYTASPVQIERLMKRDKIDEKHAELKIKAQLTLDAKRALTQYVIDNNTTKESSFTQAQTLLRTLEPGFIRTFLWLLVPWLMAIVYWMETFITNKKR